MLLRKLDATDRELIRLARAVLRRRYRAGRHTVAAAVLGRSGRAYTGVNVEACGYGPCAEPIAIGAAFTNGETGIARMVAVKRRGGTYPVLSPCGNCRQLVLDYSPDALVILRDRGKTVKARARDLLPGAYLSNFD